MALNGRAAGGEAGGELANKPAIGVTVPGLSMLQDPADVDVLAGWKQGISESGSTGVDSGWLLCVAFDSCGAVTQRIAATGTSPACCRPDKPGLYVYRRGWASWGRVAVDRRIVEERC